MHDSDNRIAQMRRQSNQSRGHQVVMSSHQRLQAVESIGDELDDTLNFKINSVLKSEFSKLCKQRESNISRELKLYMRAAVASGQLL